MNRGSLFTHQSLEILKRPNRESESLCPHEALQFAREKCQSTKESTLKETSYSDVGEEVILFDEMDV